MNECRRESETKNARESQHTLLGESITSGADRYATYENSCRIIRERSRREVLSIGRTNEETSNSKEIIHPAITGAIGRMGNSDEFRSSVKTILQLNQPTHSNDRISDSEGLSPTLKTKQEPIIQSSQPRCGDPKKGGTGPLRSSEYSFTIDRSPHYVIPVLTPDRPEKRQNGRRFKEEGDPSFTLTSQDKHGVQVNQSIRRFTPLECWRLQGFPDSAFDKAKKVTSDSQLYKQAGNAVTCNVIYAISEKLNCD